MSELTGRALAEAAAGVMGWTRDEWDAFNPESSANDDYECLVWAREHWRTHRCAEHTYSDCPFCLFSAGVVAKDYRVGDYARALVAASKQLEAKP